MDDVTTEQTAGTDLHARIREALEERIHLAKAVGRRRWERWIAATAMPTHSPVAVYVDSLAPDVEIRRAERDLRTLERHAPEPSAFRPGAYDCTYCIDTEGRPEPAPCVEVRELAAGEGIEVSDGR